MRFFGPALVVIALCVSALAARMGPAGGSDVSTTGSSSRLIRRSRLGYAMSPSIKTQSNATSRVLADKSAFGGWTDLSDPASKGAKLLFKRVAQTKNMPHAQLYLTQHINAALMRQARFAGSGVNIDEHAQRLTKRWESLGKPAEHLLLRKRDGFPAAAAKAAANNTITLSRPPLAVNTLALDIQANDIGYFATFLVGTPPRPYKVLADSGSSDFWLASTQCTDCGPHQKLGQDNSKTFLANQTTFSVKYGTGEVSGDLATDTLMLGNLLLPAHRFGVATKESVDFSASDVPFDGLMGLAKSKLSNQKVLTPIEDLAARGLVKSAQMSYVIPRFQDNAADGLNSGQITFGGVDLSRVKAGSKIQTLQNVNKKGFFAAAMSLSVNGESLNMTNLEALLDTGTTLIVAPDPIAKAIHAQIPGAQSDGQGGFTIPCTTSNTVTLTFDGVPYDIDPRDLKFQPVTDDLNGMCTSGITSGSIGGPNELLVGDVFLKNVVFSTDATADVIGLAPRA
ncbi:hypothetical protein E5Q_06041 [Mixia osmundae IAM 14324]|uniref:Peptidase A1 domain-containing protein n=1 Tax=Mixia osmundae (strain CBS 9802 / IAM 14324 / JCM 22182 / KY 12970) TaxID=764103 RepID=G7E9M7_MIXOS|nr:hypothetical protein E5Q_06041 [Mixia osmundae IAM 14324]